VGITPRKSLVWVSATEDFEHFVRLIRDLLRVRPDTGGGGLRILASTSQPDLRTATDECLSIQ
jgi:hypothetical protein